MKQIISILVAVVVVLAVWTALDWWIAAQAQVRMTATVPESDYYKCLNTCKTTCYDEL